MWIASKDMADNGLIINLDHVRKITLVDNPNYIALHFDYSVGDEYQEIQFDDAAERAAAIDEMRIVMGQKNGLLEV